MAHASRAPGGGAQPPDGAAPQGTRGAAGAGPPLARNALHIHPDREFMVPSSQKHALEGRHVSIVPAPGQGDIALAGGLVVGRGSKSDSMRPWTRMLPSGRTRSSPACGGRSAARLRGRGRYLNLPRCVLVPDLGGGRAASRESTRRVKACEEVCSASRWRRRAVAAPRPWTGRVSPLRFVRVALGPLATISWQAPRQQGSGADRPTGLGEREHARGAMLRKR